MKEIKSSITPRARAPVEHPQSAGGIRLHRADAGSVQTSMTSQFNWIWSDAKEHAPHDISIWRPQPESGNYYILGDFAQPSHSAPTGVSLIITEHNPDHDNPALKAPNGFRWMWDDKGTGGKHDGSIWYPIAPDNYVALGFVAQMGYAEPIVPTLRCVRKDLCMPGQLGTKIWDRSSGDYNISLWEVVTMSGVFFASPRTDTPPTGNVFVLQPDLLI